MAVLDEKDRLLLAALKKNARKSLVGLAKDIGLSRSATHDRIIKLEANGTIRGYTVLVNASAQAGTKAVFQINFKSGYNNPLLQKKISAFPRVIHSQCLSGDIDMFAHVACYDTDELSELREQISTIEGVSSIKTLLILKASF
ncbi:MAG: Lrp/AsnC family transcriptional regulator [Alcanivoracaceae bacterium]|nr:Lrp/AsnC family transcriptional regulator [Alcanivoracaceae bacterium]